jgi:hypothetical protein
MRFYHVKFALLLRFYGAHTELKSKSSAKVQQRRHTMSVQAPWITTKFIPRSLHAFTALLLSCRRCYWVATASLLQSHCSHSSERQVMAFVLSMFKMHAVGRHSMRCHYYANSGNVCDLTALTSAFWISFGWRENAALVWHGYNITRHQHTGMFMMKL